MAAKMQGVTGIQTINSLAYLALVISCVALIGTFVFHNEGALNGILAGYICVSYVCLLSFAGAQIKNDKETDSSPVFPWVMTALNLLGIALITMTGKTDFFWSVTIWGWLISLLFCIRRNRENNNLPLENLKKEHKILLGIVIAVTIFISTAPMGSSPFWKAGGGYPVPAYAVLADSILAGKGSIEGLPVDPKLLEMENPYDFAERIRRGVHYFHDFAFYNGKYYVYFGAVPAILLFVPYQLLTGAPLPTYHSTQIFGAFTILGIFALFFCLVKAFFAKFPFFLYLTASVVFSIVSISFATIHGNQYSTAVVSGICFEIWSLYFFVRAGWHESCARNRMRNLFWGSLCGALVFGCRPPIGLANIVLIPVLVRMWRLFPETTWKQRAARFFLAMTPYFVVAITLMLYNHARFGSPFEFGVKYNMTHLDSTAYGFDLWRSLHICKDYLFALPTVRNEYSTQDPHFFGGALLNYPVLLLVFFLLSRSVYTFLGKRQFYWFSLVLFAAAFVIALVDAIAAPWWVHERNRMDFYFLLCVVAFIALCACYETSPDARQKVIAEVFPGAALLTGIVVILLLLVPFEQSFTLYYPEFNSRLARIFLFQNVVPALPQ